MAISVSFGCWLRQIGPEGTCGTHCLRSRLTVSITVYSKYRLSKQWNVVYKIPREFMEKMCILIGVYSQNKSCFGCIVRFYRHLHYLHCLSMWKLVHEHMTSRTGSNIEWPCLGKPHLFTLWLITFCAWGQNRFLAAWIFFNKMYFLDCWYWKFFFESISAIEVTLKDMGYIGGSTKKHNFAKHDP